MAGIITSIKDVLSIKLKERHDSYTDQYTRLFMVKMILISTFLIGLNWYHDKISCIIPKNLDLSNSYVSNACWIQGFYVYDDVKAEEDTVAYYGIPTNLDYDGRYKNGKFCITDTPREHIKDEDCKPLKKIFYLQYQFMLFYVASLSLLYYLPYMLFKMMNSDVISLKSNLHNTDIDEVIASYFNHTVNSVIKMNIRVCFNILVKVLYIVVNVVAMVTMDQVLYGQFINFGGKWSTWLSLVNHMKYDYMGLRDGEKPGNVLLPTFGICEIHEGARDIRSTITNKHKFICEYSQHIFYHYVLIVLWFLFVFGIIISIMGLIVHLMDILLNVIYYQNKSKKKCGEKRTYREYEYLECIRHKNLSMYKVIVEKLRERNQDGDAKEKYQRKYV